MGDGSLWVKDRSDIDLDHDSYTQVGTDGQIMGRLILKKNVDDATVLAGFRPGSVLFQHVDPVGATFVEEFRLIKDD